MDESILRSLSESIQEFAMKKLSEEIKSLNLVVSKYKSDEMYAEKIRTAARERFRKLSREEKSIINERNKQRYENDPEYREKKRQRARERQQRIRAMNVPLNTVVDNVA